MRPKVYEVILGPDCQEKLDFLTTHGRIRNVQRNQEASDLTRLSVEMWPSAYSL